MVLIYLLEYIKLIMTTTLEFLIEIHIIQIIILLLFLKIYLVNLKKYILIILNFLSSNIKIALLFNFTNILFISNELSLIKYT